MCLFPVSEPHRMKSSWSSEKERKKKKTPQPTTLKYRVLKYHIYWQYYVKWREKCEEIKALSQEPYLHIGHHKLAFYYLSNSHFYHALLKSFCCLVWKQKYHALWWFISFTVKEWNSRHDISKSCNFLLWYHFAIIYHCFLILQNPIMPFSSLIL